MSITISFDSQTNSFSVSSSFEKELTLNSLESDAVKIITDLIGNSVDVKQLRLERRSDNYVSMLYGEFNDFLRFKITEKTKWISIRMSPKDRRDNIENSLFAAQSNKKQLHWKASIKSLSDLEQFKPYLISSCLNNT